MSDKINIIKTGKINLNKINFDNHIKVLDFLLRWYKESKQYKYK